MGGRQNMKRRLDRKVVLLLAGAFLIGFLTFLTHSYYNSVLDRIGADELENVRTYQHHFVVIVENSDLPFWQDVVQSMREEAERCDVLLELWGENRSTAMEYTASDYMDMAIAAKVDGIILEYTGERSLDRKIEAAGAYGIPVVTVLKDAPSTSRVSFVGANSYQLGQEYGRQILDLLPDGNDPVRVMALLRDNSADGSQAQVVSQINNVLMTEYDDPVRIGIEERTVSSTGNFEVEETIWNIFQSPEGPPDVFVCMDETDTEAVYQAIIDFNKVGEVQVIAYYYSDQILDAIENSTIPVTMVVDTKQMGEYSIMALTEYLGVGRVNSYYSVDLQFIDSSNIHKFREGLEES